MSARGSPVILRTIRNLSGNSAGMGQTFLATGLYLFFCVAKMLANWLRERGGRVDLEVGGSEELVEELKESVEFTVEW